MKGWGKVASNFVVLFIAFSQIILDIAERSPQRGVISGTALMVFSLLTSALVLFVFVGNWEVIRYSWRNRMNGKKIINSGGWLAWFSSKELKISIEK